MKIIVENKWRENSLFLFLFVYLSVIYLTALLLFGITEYRIGGWMAKEKVHRKIQGNFSLFPYKI
jgi:hypothetical protein